ncbi:MAG: HDIG domain-containing protein [Alphaproteobacteria bacterium]|nr:HDIG domain-containing protein [Alphaproteobacteria bacterium]
MGARFARLRQVLGTGPVRRLLALLALAVGTSLLVVDYARVPTRTFQVGDVADRDIRASTAYSYVDWASTQKAQRQAEAAVAPVFDFDATLAGRLQARVHGAFEEARQAHAELLMSARAEGRAELSEAELAGIARDFLKALELSLAQDDVQRIIDARWDRRIEELAVEYIGVTHQRFIVSDRSVLPPDERALQVVRILPNAQEEGGLDDYSAVRTPEEARQSISLYALDSGDGNQDDAGQRRAAVAIARAAVRPNFSYNQLLTEERRRAARDAVSVSTVYVPQGKTLARQGDTLDRAAIDAIEGLKATRSGGPGMLGVILALVALCALVFGVVYVYGSTQVRRFSTRDRDVEATALIGIIVLVATRGLYEVAEPLSAAAGMGMAPSSLWYMAPVAGGAMIVRILVNSESALLFTLAVAVAGGMMMDQQVLMTCFFAVSALVGAAAAVQSTERIGSLRAGLLTGLVNAGAALLINLVQVHLGGGGVAGVATASQPLWDVGFAFLGGLLSGGMVLVLVPIFELMGFVTDYKLIELANLNHPLLRQLMLRAPGTYHHSVIMGSLCESAAEAIGANPLLTRVACYFHDIGKALQPQFFIENQRGGPNPHDRLAPLQSARAIRAHVVDGQAVAEQYKLPRPVVDGIAMHHGTSLIKYFYVKAIEQAEPGVPIDDSEFRYPGPIPDTKEAGIMLLADRCEAACRTLKEPSAGNIRAMVQKLVNDAVTDGQLENCPLTVQELYKIVDSFTETLLGIYHHRIEYPGLPVHAVPRPAVDASPIITLDIDNPLRRGEEDDTTGGHKAPPAIDLVPEDPSAEHSTPEPADPAGSAG